MLNEQEQKLIAWFRDREAEMLALTEKLVNIDGGSHDKAGVDAVGEALQEWFASRGIACERFPLETYADVFRASINADAPGRQILLMGHRDTVFPKGEPTRRPYRTENGRAYGPGAADMKSGIVQDAFVLAAFAELGGAPGPLTCLFTGDEEIGTPGSKSLITEQAKLARAAFNAEPGRVNGNVVTGRRGGVFFKCEVFGKAAHAGLNFAAGHSAIAEIASKIMRWSALNETFTARNMTLNVGLVSGGQSVNTVAPHASCEIDLRYVEPKDRADLLAAIQEIADDCKVTGTSAKLSIAGEFLPFKPTDESEALFRHYQKAAADLGIELEGEYTLSCADSGLTSEAGVPTICAVGPVGGGAHSPEEYMELSSVVPRAQAVALTIARMQPEK